MKTLMTDENFILAKEEDAEAVLEFYHSHIGTPGCTWDLGYPAMEHVKMDIEKENLFLIRDDAGIVATISVDCDDLVDALPNWTIRPAREVARLAVRADMQGMGIARKMLTCVMEVLRQRGCAGIHFLVSPDNKAALASYDKLTFENKGEVFMYEHKWFCYEKRL